MRKASWLIGFLWPLLLAGAALAEGAWVQIEALPTLSEGEARARAYAGVFPNVSGFELSSGWYAIVLGPYAGDEALSRMAVLKGERMIPVDSYVADTSKFRQRFWPVGSGDLPASPPGTDTTAAAAQPAQPSGAAAPAPEPEETTRQARSSEAALPPEERELIQTAMQWEGIYDGKLDGAFGAGTRSAMAAWQSAHGYGQTGVLTTRQRAELTDAYRADLAAIGLRTVREDEAGIEIALPTALIGFTAYQPPFVQYGPKDASGYQVLLISQQGDAKTLYGLYDMMQTLEIVPLDGERERGRQSIMLTGKNAALESYTQAELKDGFIKGFTLVWPPGDSTRAGRVLEAMKSSFKPYGDHALDDGAGAPMTESRDDLMAGLQVRHPIVSRSGFFVDPGGTVVTTTDVIRQCGRVTIDGMHEADVVAQDAALGLAVIRPRAPLAPPAVASFGAVPPRRDAEVAVAGYSYEDTLDAPVMTFGTFADAKGLDGETGVSRLSLRALPGDAGGPVLDGSGAVVGMVMPRGEAGGKVLPADVAYARGAADVVTLLAAQGVTPVQSSATSNVAPEDVSRIGTGMTVLVSCWE